MHLKNPAAIIDANHSNSNKQYKEQIRIVKEVMHNRIVSPEIKTLVKGVMVESYIEEGAQQIGDHMYGKSITDPCLGWEDSEKLIYTIAEMNHQDNRFHNFEPCISLSRPKKEEMMSSFPPFYYSRGCVLV